MRKGYSSSSASEPCVICGRKSSTYSVFTQLGIDISIPVHQSAEEHCFKQLNVDKFAGIALDLVTEAIRKGGGKI